MKQAIRSLLVGCICMLGAFTAQAQGVVNEGTMSNLGILSIQSDFINNNATNFTNTSGTTTVTGNLTQVGIITITAGTVAVDGDASFASTSTATISGTLQLGGNLVINTAPAANFVVNSTLSFVGANVQTLTNNTGATLTTRILSVTKTGGSITVLGGQRLDVTNPGSTFTLNPTIVDVPIITDNSNFIRMGPTTTFTNASGLGFVRGPIERVGNGALSYVFPVGGADNGKRFVTLDNIVAGSIVRIEVGLGGSPTGISGFTPSGVRYYSLQVISGGGIPASTNLTLTYNNTSGTNDAVVSAATVSTGRSDTGTDGPFINNGSGGVGSPNGIITRALLASINAGNTSIFRIGVNLPAAGAGTLAVTYSSPTPCEYDRPLVTVAGGNPLQVQNYTFEYFDGIGYSAIPGVTNPVTIATATAGVNGFPLQAGGIQYRVTANPQSGFSASILSQTTPLNASITIRVDVRVFLQAVYNPSLATDPMRSSQLTPGQLQLAYTDYTGATPAGVYPRNTVGGAGPFTNAQERLFVPVKDRIYNTTVGDTSTIRVPARVGTLFPVDVVMIGLRSAANFSSSADDTLAGNFKYAWVMTDGSIREFRLGNSGPNYVTFCGLSNGNYHVVVRHRNHIPIASIATSLTANGVVQTVDFTNKNNVYGLAGVQGGGFIHSNDKVSMFRGKITERVRVANASRYVNAYDFFTVFTNQTGIRGIYSADLNFDGRVDSGDYLGIQNSIDNLFFSTVPIW